MFLRGGTGSLDYGSCWNLLLNRLCLKDLYMFGCRGRTRFLRNTPIIACNVAGRAKDGDG